MLTYDTLLKRLTITGIIALIIFVLSGVAANATTPELNVDGTVYAPSQISGPTVHYETPDINPQAAFSDRHVWSGNGSEHLPCPAGIHWIDNKNVLTISHCLEGEPPSSTTTTVPPTTTTSSSTTTTAPEVTTTTIASSTTTTTLDPTTTSSTSTPVTSSTVPTPCDETDPPTCLPHTGATETLIALAVAGLLTVVLGAAALYGSSKMR